MREALAFALALATPVPLPTPQALPYVAFRAPRAQLRVQIARTPAQRERGLMAVVKLPPRTGMLFVFEHDGPLEFWMKDTLVPLDMVFIAGNGVVRSVFANVPVVPTTTPDNLIPRRDGFAKYVLELPAGEAVHDGFSRGAVVPGISAIR